LYHTQNVNTITKKIKTDNQTCKHVKPDTRSESCHQNARRTAKRSKKDNSWHYQL